MIKAPGIAEQRWLIGVPKALAEDQIGYFEETFSRLGIEPASFDLSQPSVAAFRIGMLRIADDGDYPDIVTAMFAAEWMYWHWCTRASMCPISDPVLRRWVDLHAEEAFADQARWLKREVDRAGEVPDELRRRRLSAIFGTALRLEIDFHTATYG
jgi:thiaminase/transcriptional activator TenA